MMIWPLREALWNDGIPGAGPDIISTLWGNWWFSQDPLTAIVGGWTNIANHPNGVWGAVLSPSSAMLFTVLYGWTGIGRASALVDIAQLGGLCAATGALAHRLGVRPLGVFVAGMAPLVCRYMIYALGEASVVAVVGMGVPIGLIGLLDAVERQGRRAKIGAGLVAACMGLSAFENPYLAPVLPAAAAGMIALRWRQGALDRELLRRLVLAVVAGVAIVVAAAALFARVSSPEYPFERTEHVSYLLWVIPLPIVEQPWAAAEVAQLLWPTDTRWVLEASLGMQASGGRYVGLSTLVLSVVGAALGGWRGLRWAAFGWLGILLAMGSMVGPIGGPFLYLNAIMDLIARPLTQPTRYLVCAVVGMGVASGMALDALRARLGVWPSRALAAAVVLDAFVLGGLSLTLPTTWLPDADCLSELDGAEGGVLMWPLDATNNVRDLPRTQLFQMLHGHPSPQPGIASWAIEKNRARADLDEAGYAYREQTREPQPLRPEPKKLLEMGYRWVVVDEKTLPRLKRLPETWFGEPMVACGDIAIHEIPDAR